MQVTVSNELTEGSGGEVKPYRLTITPEDGADDAGYGEITFPYNPEQYGGEVTSSWEPRGAAGVPPELNPSDWVNSDPDTLEFEARLHPQSPDENDRILSALRVWCAVPSRQKQRPPILTVIQGAGKTSKRFTGHLEGFSWRALQTDAKGRIRTLYLSLRFVRNLVHLL